MEHDIENEDSTFPLLAITVLWRKNEALQYFSFPVLRRLYGKIVQFLHEALYNHVLRTDVTMDYEIVRAELQDVPDTRSRRPSSFLEASRSGLLTQHYVKHYMKLTRSRLRTDKRLACACAIVHPGAVRLEPSDCISRICAG